MSIISEIERIQNAVGNAYLAVGNNGGTIPSTLGIDNLPSAIQSVYTNNIQHVVRHYGKVVAGSGDTDTILPHTIVDRNNGYTLDSSNAIRFVEFNLIGVDKVIYSDELCCYGELNLSANIRPSQNLPDAAIRFSARFMDPTNSAKHLAIFNSPISTRSVSLQGKFGFDSDGNPFPLSSVFTDASLSNTTSFTNGKGCITVDVQPVGVIKGNGENTYWIDLRFPIIWKYEDD